MKRVLVIVCVLAACGPDHRNGDDGPGGGSGGDGGTKVCPVCTADKSGIEDCNGNVTTCPDQQACSNGACMDACAAAEANHESVGCDYYAVDMDAAQGPPQDACFTVFVANTSASTAHMQVEWGGGQIDLSRFAKLPAGAGTSLTYQPYDPAAGIAPGQVAIIFLAYAPALMNVSCPVPAAVGTDAQIAGTGMGKAFHLTTDNPVVAYQMLPYGGGRAAATGASLLLPTSAWDKNYVVVTAYDVAGQPPINFGMGPSFDIVAKEDNTTITMRPKSAVTAGAGLVAGTAGQPYTFTLNKGQYAQFTQQAQMSGSPVQADKPIGVFGGHQIMSIDRCCGDHGEQMLAPVRAVGYEYVAAPHGQRKPSGSDPRIFRIFGTVDGTQLTYDPPNLGPSSLGLGGWIEIRTEQPFVVHSQDKDHPVEMFTYMSGAGEQGEGGWGDADFVRLPPPEQYLAHYVFFTDPTYPFTMLTVVRTKHEGHMEDVTLDCLGPISGWTPVGTSGQYEIAYVKLVDHFNPVGSCNNGVHVMDSKGQFGVWVWGWGSEDTDTGWVSYGYPAGEGVLPINDIVVGAMGPGGEVSKSPGDLAR